MEAVNYLDLIYDLVNQIHKTIQDAVIDNTHIVNKMVNNLKGMNCFSNLDSILAVSTLRGELADNKEWKENPTKPAIIIGTVDMIGSKILFSGYGDTRRTRPLHAGILGCDTLFIHDESHLTPAYGKLLRSVKQAQSEHSQLRNDLPTISNIQIMELSATPNFDSGNIIKGNTYQSVGDMIINEKYSPEKIVEIIEVIQYKVDESNISKKNKQEIEGQFEKVKSQIALKDPDIKSISKSINKVNEILKKTKESSDNLIESCIFLFS